MISEPVGQIAELVHDPEHTPTRRLRVLAFDHRANLELNEVRRHPACLQRLSQAVGEPLHERGSRCKRHQDRKQSPLVNQQSHLWSPKAHGAIPISEHRRRLRYRRHDRLLHPVEQLLRCVQTEHRHHSRIDPPDANVLPPILIA